jgi:hypothetical protein
LPQNNPLLKENKLKNKTTCFNAKAAPKCFIVQINQHGNIDKIRIFHLSAVIVNDAKKR